MEKYSRWSDLSTGINPFVPSKGHVQDNFIIKSGKFIVRAVLFIFRFVLVAIVLISLLLLDGISTSFLIIPIVGRLIKRLINWILCSLLLILLGVIIQEAPANTRRLGLTAPRSKASSVISAPCRNVQAKELIVCNHTCFIEILYFAKRFSPVFAFTSEDGASKGLVQVCGLSQALFRAFSPPLQGVPTSFQKISDVMKQSKGPIIVFPEGCRSNGKAILKFLPILDFLPPTRIHLVAFRFDVQGNEYSPSFSAGSSWSNIWNTLSHVYYLLQVTLLDGAVLEQSGGLSTQINETLRTHLATMIRSKPVSLSVPDFISFNAYWDHVTSGGRRPASDFTDRKAPHEHAQWSKRT